MPSKARSYGSLQILIFQGLYAPSKGHVSQLWCSQEVNLYTEGEFHGPVVSFGTSGMAQVDRPLVLVPLVPPRSEDPLLLVPLVPRLQLVPSGCTTCPLPTLFSQNFFWFLTVIPFFEKHF